MTVLRVPVIRLLVFLIAIGVTAQAELPTITAKSVLLFDANSGKVLYKKNENAQRPVASTQKLLTALIVAEDGGMERIVTIAASDANAEPTKLYLKPGDRYSRQKLLTALLVKSPNDVARALARDNAGSVSAFAEKMNRKMQSLGGMSSHFVNPNGLPASGQYSTARDMARVARAAFFNNTLRPIMRTKYYPFTYASGKTVTLKNTNRVLREYAFCNGMKTGYTDLAGHCLISSGTWNGKSVIAVVMGTTKARIWNESAALLAYGLGLSQTQLASLHSEGTESAN